MAECFQSSQTKHKFEKWVFIATLKTIYTEISLQYLTQTERISNLKLLTTSPL